MNRVPESPSFTSSVLTKSQQVKINDRGIAALAYSTKLNAGTTLGLGLSLDTAKLNEAGHKIGTSLTFEG